MKPRYYIRSSTARNKSLWLTEAGKFSPHKWKAIKLNSTDSYSLLEYFTRTFSRLEFSLSY